MIKRLMFGVSAAALSMTVASVAHAQAHFGASAGVSMPVSTFGDAVKAGYNGGGNSQIIDGAVNLVVSSPASSIIKPYVTGGLGVYRNKYSSTGLLSGESTSTKLGFNGGAGLSFGLSGFQTHLEARYVYITKENGADAVQYVPVSFGILF